MNKSDFIAKIAENSGLTKTDADKFLCAFVATVKEALANGEKIQILGFGNFELKDKAAREGINPLTKQPLSIPASKVPAFKVSKTFKDEFNK